MTDYYTPPSDHPNQIGLDKIEDQIDALVDERRALEMLDRDMTPSEEDRYNAIAIEIKDLDSEFDSIYWEQ
jgi:hypothetical protein